MTAFAWNILLALAWTAINGEFSGTNLFVGFVFGYLILGVTLRDRQPYSDYLHRIPRFLRFLAFFLRELALSNLRVAHDILTPTHHMRPAVIAYPLEAETDGEITLLANVISLTPGTLSLDVSSDRKVLYLHIMYLNDEQAMHDNIRALESRLLSILR